MRRHEPDMLPALNQGAAQAACAAIQKSSPFVGVLSRIWSWLCRKRVRAIRGVLVPWSTDFETRQHPAERLVPSLIAKRMNEDLFVDDETIGSGRESKA